jgi:hypothetical protein
MTFGTANPTAARDALIVDWQDKARRLQALKEEELLARNKVVGFFFEETTDKAGTENFDLTHGYKIKLTFAQNHSVPSAKNGEAVKGVIEKLAKLGEDGKFIADRLFRWKPELSKTEWDALSPSMKRIVAPIVTTKAAQPTVEIIAPKAV